MEISIIIPVYNRASIVKRTLDSVKGQTHRPIHLILVDNGSSDNTIEILNKFRNENNSDSFKVSIGLQWKKGACAARNYGLHMAESEWVMFFDSDDIMDSNLLELYVNKIRNSKKSLDLLMCRGDVKELDGSVREQPYYNRNLLANHILHTLLNPQRYIIRKTFLERCGEWNEHIYGWNDWELGARILIANPNIEWIKTKIPVHIYAQEDSITGTNYSDKSEFWEYAIDCVERNLIKSKRRDVGRLLFLVEYKRLCLAGLYNMEGSEKGEILYHKIMNSPLKSVVKNIFFPMLYHHISNGRSGGAQIAKRLVGYF